MSTSSAITFQQGVILISGATRSGKTYFTHKLLCNLDTCFTKPYPQSILFCYGIYQPLFRQIESM